MKRVDFQCSIIFLCLVLTLFSHLGQKNAMAQGNPVQFKPERERRENRSEADIAMLEQYWPGCLESTAPESLADIATQAQYAGLLNPEPKKSSPGGPGPEKPKATR